MKALTVARKDMLVYYMKGPVIIFGILLPSFLFLAFLVGRNLPLNLLIADLLSMTVFFASTSVPPVIAPWEGQARTLERLISCPISIRTMLIGDVMASMAFGTAISCVPLIIGLLAGAQFTNPLALLLAIPISTFCFSSLGLLFSAYPSNIPANAMMVSSLVKFPLIFISGIFIPIQSLPRWGRTLALLSPLTYFTDVSRYSLGLEPYLCVCVDLLALALFSIAFFALAVRLHEAVTPKRL